MIAAGSQSQLPKPVIELIQIIFDVEAMKDALLEFEVILPPNHNIQLAKLCKHVELLLIPDCPSFTFIIRLI